MGVESTLVCITYNKNGPCIWIRLNGPRKLGFHHEPSKSPQVLKPLYRQNPLRKGRNASIPRLALALDSVTHSASPNARNGQLDPWNHTENIYSRNSSLRRQTIGGMPHCPRPPAPRHQKIPPRLYSTLIQKPHQQNGHLQH